MWGVVATVLASAPTAHAYQVGREYDGAYDSERTALAVYHPDGTWTGSSAAKEERAALSLAKLYLGYYVLNHGTDEEKNLVEYMITYSDDGYAEILDETYPEAIDSVAADFDLEDTYRNESWGRSVTSAYDVAKFVASILSDSSARPLIDGMRNQSETASDGFHQVFGTALLKNAEGTKTGWSNDEESETGSVSFGSSGMETWVAAALTNGDAAANTADALRGIDEAAEFNPWKPGDRLAVSLSTKEILRRL
ncbi:hypothetical protein CAPI_00325 [Corynebacterium capitovis DSM 44611]|nr:hypothetical protein CAPI_00325 [Corynebacterium capitovis DSM 44611]